MHAVVLQGFPLWSPINKTYVLTGLVGESEDLLEDNHHHSFETGQLCLSTASLCLEVGLVPFPPCFWDSASFPVLWSMWWPGTRLSQVALLV